jgi:flagellar basal-body rod protein FlgC
MLNAIDISTSGLIAQRQRMNTIAGNIANVNTTRGSNGELEPFQRRLIRFSTEDVSSREGSGAAGVEYHIEVDTANDPRRVHDPGHPDADGYGAFPNINLVTEFVNALEANRAYEANVAAIEVTKEMSDVGLRILA